MTKQEFESGIGYEVTDEQYEAAERLWLATANFNKDEFYEDWKKHHDSSILADIAHMNETHKFLYEHRMGERDELAKLLLGVTDGAITGTDARKKMLEIFSYDKRIYARLLVECDSPLTEEEKDVVLSCIR